MQSNPILDCHIHFGHPNYMPGLISILDGQGVGKFNIVCTPSRERLSLVPDALYVKSFHPRRAYVFGGLDISAFFLDREHCGRIFADFVDRLAEMGCDGVKMIEGKPDMRKMLPIPPFDGPEYEPYWQKMEETGMPLLWHVNDPEVRHVLERHPGLRVVFAHFFFLSAQLPRLAEWLDRFPNMHVDLTPGIEMYHNFSQATEATRDFFMKYQDRILFGTDIGAKALLNTPEMGIEPQESRLRLSVVRRFLETVGEFQLEEDGFLFGKFAGAFRGIGLPQDALEKIAHANFERLAGASPRVLNPPAVVAECERLERLIPMMAAAQPGVGGDFSVAGRVGERFKTLAG